MDDNKYFNFYFTLKSFNQMLINLFILFEHRYIYIRVNKLLTMVKRNLNISNSSSLRKKIIEKEMKKKKNSNNNKS